MDDYVGSEGIFPLYEVLNQMLWLEAVGTAVIKEGIVWISKKAEKL